MGIADWITQHAGATPDKTAVRFEGAEISYRALAARIEAAARVLARDFAVGRGNRVAHLGLNHPDTLVLLFACARLGAILLPLNWRLAPPEHAFMLRDSGATLLIAEPEFAEHVGAIGAAAADLPKAGLGGPVDDWRSWDGLITAADGYADTGASDDDPVLLV